MAKVLIVDDAMFIRQLLKDMLVKGGHQVVAEAAHGQEAVTMFQQHQPDITTMDIIMGEGEGMNGIDAVRNIVNIQADAKIVMVTSLGHNDVVVEALKAGAKDFIVKPFNEEQVLSTVQRILNEA